MAQKLAFRLEGEIYLHPLDEILKWLPDMTLPCSDIALTERQIQAVTEASERCGDFLGRPVLLEWVADETR